MFSARFGGCSIGSVDGCLMDVASGRFIHNLQALRIAVELRILCEIHQRLSDMEKIY